MQKQITIRIALALFIFSGMLLGCDAENTTPAQNQFPKVNSVDTTVTPANENKANLLADPKIIDEKDIADLLSTKEKNPVKVNDVTLKFSSIAPGKKWVHDNYGDSYLYNDAERGSIYMIARVAISADSKDPQLPPISVICLDNNKLSVLGDLSYSFVKWESYGDFLGNYADYGNDFAHTKTIGFNCAHEMADSFLKKTIFIAVKNDNVYGRHEDRFGEPPITYRGRNNDDTLTYTDFKKNYTIVKVFNKNHASTSAN